MNIRTWLLGICVCGLVMISSAPAQLVVVEEHVFDFSLTSTPWNMSVVVPYYDPADYNGAPLEEVMVTLNGTANSEVDVEAQGGDVVVLSGDVGAMITASGFINGLAIDVLPSGTFAPPSVLVPDGQELNLTDVSGTDLDMLIVSGAQNVAGFVGNGSFQVDVGAIGSSQISTSGGNMDTSQRTDAESRLTVQYKISVPEPSAVFLLLLASGGLGLLRRR